MSVNNKNLNLPEIENGCVIKSWRCSHPNKEEQNEREEMRKKCKRCETCNMVFCEYHMTESRHMQDCGFRVSQENKVIKEQREEAQENVKKIREEIIEKEKNQREKDELERKARLEKAGFND